MAKYEYSITSLWRSKTLALFTPEVWGQCSFCFRVLHRREWVERIRQQHPERSPVFTREGKAFPNGLCIESRGLCSECIRFV